MYRIGVCGHFGGEKNLLNGQTVKTKLVTEELELALGSGSVKTVDTHSWKKNPFMLLVRCFQLIKSCKNVAILPAQNGISVFVPLFLLLNKFYNRKLHYIVIGGWLPELLEKDVRLQNQLKKFNAIYVETNSMLDALVNLGFKNVKYLPNFKRLAILEKDQLVFQTNQPYKLCTFSRVMKEKGIENAIESVKFVNEMYGKEVYTLDIYGQIEERYSERFEEIKKNFPNYISYKGLVDFDKSVDVLKDYFALLFPTYYEGEGFAGTILDAYAAGVPVIATNWRYNGEIINDEHDGLLYDYKNSDGLSDILIKLYSNPDTINNMKNNCLERAKQFTPEIVINTLIRSL